MIAVSAALFITTRVPPDCSVSIALMTMLRLAQVATTCYLAALTLIALDMLSSVS